MDINTKLAESPIDAFDSEDTAIVFWDSNDNVILCDMSNQNQILISSDDLITARNEIKVKSAGLKRLKSGQDIQMLECV